MKQLKITYGDAVLWDAPVGSLEWHDSEDGVRVDGRVNTRLATRPASSPKAGGSGILDMLVKASKAKTSQAAEGKREAYEAGGVADCNTVIVETVEPELEDSA